MRQARVFVKGIAAGRLEALDNGCYRFIYDENYQGEPVSLTMPVTQLIYEYDTFPPFFDGVLPEGAMLDALLRYDKLDKKDYFGQLVAVGEDLVGAVTVEEII